MNTVRLFNIFQSYFTNRKAYERERGVHPEDVTCFLESQKDWGPVRNENWAEVLYFFQKGKYHKDPEYQLENWKFGERIVISDHDNLPILAYRDLPDTLSSALEGRDIEAIKRTNPRIQHRDILARMPMTRVTKAGTRTTLYSPSSIGMKMSRFRTENGMLSWTPRCGSKIIRNALWDRLPQANKWQNSIRGLQPPTLDQQQEIKKVNKGKFLNRAGKRALTSQERNRRQKIAENRRTRREGKRPATGSQNGTNPPTTACEPVVNSLIGGEDEREGHYTSLNSNQMPPDTLLRTQNPVSRFPPLRSWLQSTLPLTQMYRAMVWIPILCLQPEWTMGSLLGVADTTLSIDRFAIESWSLRR